MERLRDIIKNNTTEESKYIDEQISKNNLNWKDAWYWNLMPVDYLSVMNGKSLSHLTHISADIKNIYAVKVFIQILPIKHIPVYIDTYIDMKIIIILNQIYRGLLIRQSEENNPKINKYINVLKEHINLEAITPNLSNDEKEPQLTRDIAQTLIMSSDPETILQWYMVSDQFRKILEDYDTLTFLSKEYNIEDELEVSSFRDFLEILQLKYPYDLGNCIIDRYKCIKRSLYIGNKQKILDMVKEDDKNEELLADVITAASLENDVESWNYYYTRYLRGMKKEQYDYLGEVAAYRNDVRTVDALYNINNINNVYKGATLPYSTDVLKSLAVRRLSSVIDKVRDDTSSVEGSTPEMVEEIIDYALSEYT